MGKNPNTFAKRQRETDKKRKAEDKRTRRRHRKESSMPDDNPHVPELPDETALDRLD